MTTLSEIYICCNSEEIIIPITIFIITGLNILASKQRTRYGEISE